MAKRLTEFVNPRNLQIQLSDIANGIGKPAETLSLPEQAEDPDGWKWPEIFLVTVEGEGGRFCSYRVLECWLLAVIELLTSCADWEQLEELIAVTEAELERYCYPLAHREQLQAVLVQQKARLEDLKVKATGLINAWDWAKGWERVLTNCPDEKALNMAVELFKTQKALFAEYPDAIESVRQVGRKQRRSLQLCA
ncbi:MULTISPECIES: hypothetical protein [Aerosakkonema]|uniref:hypothetical protein n=1 Tax=Aerosakkonema TaxID=1246629 RepID=UPI0035B8F4CD